MHRAVVLHACAEGVESSDRLRMDSLAVETNIHHPTDSSLLEDSVRVITRILARAAKEFPACLSADRAPASCSGRAHA